MNKVCSNVLTAQKCENYATYFRAKLLLIAYKTAYSCCLSLGENLDFLKKNLRNKSLLSHLILLLRSSSECVIVNGPKRFEESNIFGEIRENPELEFSSRESEQNAKQDVLENSQSNDKNLQTKMLSSLNKKLGHSMSLFHFYNK